MMHWIKQAELWLQWLAGVMPLDLFVVIGSFLEEIVGPIPSTLVMTTAGVLARADERTLLYVFWLAVIGNLGKTLGAYVYYVVGDKLEDVVLHKYGRLLHLSHTDIERIGQRFGQQHWKDGGMLFLLRLIPFFPTTAVSLVCGIIKMDRRIYLLATYGGNFGKDLFLVYSGFAGLGLVRVFMRDLVAIHHEINFFLVGGFLLAMSILYWQRHHGQRAFAYFTALWKKSNQD